MCEALAGRRNTTQAKSEYTEDGEFKMKSRASALITLAFLAGVTSTGECFAQALPDSLVERIRAGAAGLVLPGDSVAVPLVGTPPLPVVEVSVNETGPYRFLIDLGSNVTVLRRNVVDASRSTVLVERATSDIAYVEAIALGAARLEGVTVASYDELDVDGVLGYNVLQYSSFTLDFPGKRLVLHRESLPPPDDRTVFSYQLVGRMPYITVRLGHDSLLVNLDTGAAEWMTVPPSWQARLRWAAAPVPGRTTFNNQTGRTQVLEGRLADTLSFGELTIVSPLVYVNPDAEDAWLGAAAMAGAVWTFDPQKRHVQVRAPSRDR
jgi:predicted aspartyl protease